MVDVILGLQWGDEGKGKIVDYFAPKYDVIARFQGGPNAGHTLYVNGTKMVLHQIPSGIFHQDKINIAALTIESKDGMFEGTIKVFVHDKDELEELVARIQALNGIQKVTRFDTEAV